MTAVKRSKPKQPKSGIRTSSVGIAQGAKVHGAQPRTESTPRGMRIHHREFCQDVSSSTVFAVSKFLPINPGNEELFPWLSPVATRFESYRFENLKFIYEPLVPTTAPGVMLMAVDFESADPLPSSKQVMMSYKSSVRCSLWESCELKLAKADMQKIKDKFTLDHAPSTSTDVRLYNVGNLAIASTGAAAAAICGELYVEYDVIVETPQIETSGEGVKVTWTAGTSPTSPFTTGNYTTTPTQQSDSYFSFGNVAAAAGLGAAGFAIYKAGSYLWDSYFAPDVGSGATTLPPDIVSVDGNATVTPDNPDGVTGAVTTATAGNLSHLLIKVNKVPAAFTLSAFDPTGGHGIKAGSTFNITPID